MRCVRCAPSSCILPHKDVTEQVSGLVHFFHVDVFEYDALLASYPAKHQGFHPSSHYRWMLMYDHLASLQPATLRRHVHDRRAAIRCSCAIPSRPSSHRATGLYVAMESALVPIAQEGWNSGWIRDCFGNEMVQKVGRETVSCSGTTLGTWAAALAVSEAHLAPSSASTRACERNGIDQGVHNVIVHTGHDGVSTPCTSSATKRD